MSLRNLPEIRAFQQSDILHFEPPAETAAEYRPEIQAAASKGEAVISIYGQIGTSIFTDIDNTERRVGNELRAIGPRDVTVNVNSPGGNFFNGLAIYNLLRAHPAKVTINVIGMAGSAASVIAMAGDEINMADGSVIMIHRASALIMGNHHDARDAAEMLADADDAMAELYAARAGVEKSMALSWMDKSRGKGTMFSAASAIEKGLADKKMAAGAVNLVKADVSAKPVPVERAIERALMASGSSAADAKALISQLKSGKRDDALNVKRDADRLRDAVMRARSTLQIS